MSVQRPERRRGARGLWGGRELLGLAAAGRRHLGCALHPWEAHEPSGRFPVLVGGYYLSPKALRCHLLGPTHPGPQEESEGGMSGLRGPRAAFLGGGALLLDLGCSGLRCVVGRGLGEMDSRGGSPVQVVLPAGPQPIS